MLPQDIAKLGRLLGEFLSGFAACFARPAGRQLLLVYMRGLLSGVQRKNAEAIALDQKVAPRTLQRFLESIVWDEEQLRDRCQQLVATEHAHSDAIGCVDETGTAKSGQHTTGVKRQYNGGHRRVALVREDRKLRQQRGDCVFALLGIQHRGFDCLLDARLYLPDEWADDAVRRKKTVSPTTSSSRPNRRLRWT